VPSRASGVARVSRLQLPGLPRPRQEQLQEGSDGGHFELYWGGTEFKGKVSCHGSDCNAAIVIAAMTTVVIAVFFNEAPIALARELDGGQRIWVQRAGCSECHGWAGDGIGGADRNAPSLRETQLTRDQIREAVQCGRPGTEMPYFDRFAYTDKRCYGLTSEALGDRMPNRAPTTLQSYEIDALADYIATKLKGAGAVTRGQCLDFFGPGGSRCDNYHK
jgi:mono/diheme cytochrome c family protein